MTDSGLVGLTLLGIGAYVGCAWAVAKSAPYVNVLLVSSDTFLTDKMSAAILSFVFLFALLLIWTLSNV